MFNNLFSGDIEILESPFNGQIKVRSFLGRVSVWVGGYEQSGPLVRKVWQKALKELPLPKQGELLRNVLILGLGCGVAAKLISEKFPNAKITGVEIDPVMVEIGKKYFGLSGIQIKIMDAVSFIKRTRQKFDLILIDAYFGNKAADFSKTKLPLTRSGLAVFNILKDNKNTVSVVKLGS
jgi:spermidine synthase